jgi:hypothetical protein
VFAKFVLMKIHADALAPKSDAFALQPHLLFKPGFTWQADVASGAKHAVPRESARRTQRPHYLASSAGKSRSRGDLAVSGYLALRDFQNDGTNLGEHAFRINEPRKMKRCLSCSIATIM